MQGEAREAREIETICERRPCIVLPPSIVGRVPWCIDYKQPLHLAALHAAAKGGGVAAWGCVTLVRCCVLLGLE